MSDSIVINVVQEAAASIEINDTGENIYLNPLTLNQGVINHSVTHQSGGSDELSHNLLGGLYGGQSGQYYHLNSGQYFNLTTGDVVRPSETGQFYPSSNPSGFITGVDLSGYVSGDVVRPSETGNFITTSQTGAFYASSNPSGFITGIDLSNYASIPFVTGVSGYLQGQITILNNQTGQYLLTGQTGQFYPNSNPSGFITGIPNIVYTTGDQSITGVKSFVNDIHAQSIYSSGAISGDSFQFDTSANITVGVGQMAWNDTDGTLDIGMKGGNVTLQVGQENVVRVVNKTSADLLESEFKVVRIRSRAEGGAQGQRLAVVLAKADNEIDSATTLGVVTENIANNQEGFITVFGEVRGINTRTVNGETWEDGDMLYLSPTIAGGLTKVKPEAPNHTVIMGYVVYAHNNQGKIFVKVDNGYELNELHNVAIESVVNGDGLLYNEAQGVWQNRQVVNADSDQTIYGVKTFLNGIVTDDSNLFIQMGMFL